jgi:site-specific recombinase XerD
MELKHEEDILYIPEHEDFQIMKKVYTPEVLKISKGVWNQAFEYLKEVLYITYGSCQFGLFVTAVEKNALEEAIKVSHNLNKVAILNNWSEKTIKTAICNMKRILKQTTISPHFINKLTTVKTGGIDRKSLEYCLPSEYKKYDDNHLGKKQLLMWMNVCKKETRNRSQSSLKQIILFTIKVCNNLNLNINNFNLEKASMLPLETIQLAMDQVDLKISTKIRVRFTCIIIKKFFNSKVITHFNLEEWKKSIPKEDSFECGDDHDAHRISNMELDLMFEAAKSNNRDLALFLLMATTGLRVGGVSNLLLKNVCTQVGGEPIISNEGRTIEKGKKWFTFVICERLKEALKKYIIEDRNVLSDYVFSGQKQGPLSPSRISKIIKEIATRANISGKHIHAHSIRHSFAHILLEAGNDPGLVGKMMGHSSSKTTEKYYLKETAVEASKRCNIPWLTKEKEVTPLPTFMTPLKKEKPTLTRKIKQNKKKQALKLISQEFANKTILPTLPEV